MKLQLALDMLSPEEIIKIIDDTKEYIDIFEIGTPAIVLNGVKQIKKIKEIYPDVVILADTKIMDGGKVETQYAIDCGADIVTVLGCASSETIKNSIEVAHKNNKKCLVDLIEVNDIKKRGAEIVKLGADYVCAHTGIDVQKLGIDPFEDIAILSEICSASNLAIAGGINYDTVDKIIPYNLGIIIVGGAITTSKNPQEEAKKIKGKILN